MHPLILAAVLPLLAQTALPSTASLPSTKIRHVVVIVQENRSFDNMFRGYPGADTVNAGKDHEGRTIVLRPTSFAYPHDLNHTHLDFLQQYDHGKMDGFSLELPDAELGRPEPRSNLAYSYLPQREVQPYWEMASQYVLADRMFESNSGPSFTAHQYLIAGQSGGALDNPSILDQKVYAWGCDSPPNARVTTVLSTNPGQGVYPCFDYKTLGDLLDARQVAWRYYAPSFGKLGAIWSAYDAIHHIRFGPDWKTDVINPETRVLTDIAAGNLAPVTWVVPSTLNSDHAFPFYGKMHNIRMSSANGPSWVASIVNAIGTSRYWNDTAILLLWDDWGGWYDHVPPPQIDRVSLGMRVPLLVISPYAKRGYISHKQHEFGSIVKFTEEVYGLPSLNGVDVRSDDLLDCFDFSQRPRTFTKISAPQGAAFFLQDDRIPPVPPDDD
jgi:phospholipase C